jgi:predicted Zn-dependent protease
MNLRKYFTPIILLVLSISLVPAFAEAIEPNALISIYERLNIGKTCREIGFSKCKFVIKDNDEENAYVTGDGNIYIYTGLLRNVRSEDELAFIVAHEIGHLIYRHPHKRAEDVGWLSLGNIIAQIFVEKDDTKLLIDSVSGAITSTYTKNQEREADLYAIQTVYDAGYDPLKGINFFYRSLDAEKRIKYKPKSSDKRRVSNCS